MKSKSADSKGRERVECKLCGEYFHRLDVHLSRSHDSSVALYGVSFPGEPTISEYASKRASKAQRSRGKKGQAVIGPKAMVAKATKAERSKKEDLDKPFSFGVAKLYQRRGLGARDQAFIPEHDADWKVSASGMDLWEALAIGIQEKENVYIGGPTGCGKTAGVREMASILSQPLFRFNMHSQYKVSHFVGKTELIVDEETGQSVTRWIDGPFTKCVRFGWWALVDEFDRAPEGVLMSLQSILEGGDLVLETGEVVKRHPEFRLVATGNTMGRGDDSGLYSAARVLDEATMDRFGVVMAADYPVLANEVDIVVAKGGVSVKDAKRMVEVAHKVRESFEKEMCYCTLSTRRLISWANKAKLMKNVRRASKITVLNKLGRDDRKFVDGMIQRYFGGEV